MKNKINDKIRKISAFAIALLTILTATSCSSGVAEKEGVDDTELSFATLEVIPSKTTVSVGKDVIPEASNYVILRESSAEEGFTEGGALALSDEIVARSARIKSKYGITITETVSQSLVTDVMADYLSGSLRYDMIIMGASSFSSLVPSGALANLNSTEGYLGDGEEYGFDKNTEAKLSINGRLYALTGDALVGNLSATNVIMVDNKTLSMTGITADELSKTVLDGDFTYEAMLKYEKASAILMMSENQALSLFLSSGLPIYSSDKVTDMPEISDFCVVGSDKSRLIGAIYDNARTLFTSEKTITEEDSSKSPLFTVTTLGEYEKALLSGKEVSLAPMPKLYQTQSEYSCPVSPEKASFAALPSAKGTAEALNALNILFFESAGFDDVRANKIGESSAVGKTAEIVKLIDKTKSFELVSVFGWGDFGELLSSCVTQGISTDQFLTRCEERARAAQAAMEIMIDKMS